MNVVGGFGSRASSRGSAGPGWLLDSSACVGKQSTLGQGVCYPEKENCKGGSVGMGGGPWARTEIGRGEQGPQGSQYFTKPPS